MAFDPISSAFDLGSKIIDRVWQDPAKKAEAYLELRRLEQSGDLAIMAGQTEINKIEAANPNLFVSGWRPFIGWICGLGFAVQFILGPIGGWFTTLIGHPVLVPTLDLSTLSTLLIGMLGLSGMRTVEKLSNAQGNH